MMQLYNKTTKRNGFSIIELTIILTIFSFFAVNALITQDTTRGFASQKVTTQKLDTIKSALSAYVKTYGHYPCPADGEKPIVDNDIGVSDDGISNDAGTKEFLTAGIPECGQAKQEFNAKTHDDTTFGAPEFANDLSEHTSLAIGVVPIRKLGLPTEYMIDGFGNRITYVVRRELTDTTSFAMASNATGNGGASFGAEGGRSLEVVNETGDPISNNAAWVLISHGPNGYGAYPFSQGLSLSVGANTVTRIPPGDIGVSPDCDTTGNNIVGTFSDGELRNHHLCEEASGITPIFDDIFFIPLAPETHSGNNIIAYDDVVVWGLQESHDLSQANDNRGSPPMIPFYEGTLDLHGEGPGASPDQFPGLALWYDVQDCRAVFTGGAIDGSTGGQDICDIESTELGTDYAIDNIAEKISLFNNYYQDSFVQNRTYGNRAMSTGNKKPLYKVDPTDPNIGINGNPALLFDGVNDFMVKEGMFSSGLYNNPVDDPSLSTEDFTVFVVFKPNNFGAGTPERQTLFGRTKLLASNPSEGFAILGVNGTTNWDSVQIGFGVDDFNNGGAPNNTVVSTATNNPQIVTVSYNDTGAQRIYSGCPLQSENPTAPAMVHPVETGATSSTAAVLIGSLSPSEGAFDGYIGEIIMYSRELQDWEREDVVRYLGNKWGFGTGEIGTCSAVQPSVPTDCGTDLLLGDTSATAATDCCSQNWDGTDTCCMASYQSHIEKCVSDDQCCNGQCNAFGFCYNSAHDNPIVGDADDNL